MIALLFISLLGVTCMLFEILNLKKVLPVKLIAGLIASLVAIAWEWNNPIEVATFYGMLQMNHFALAFSGGLIFIVLLWLLLALPDLKNQRYQTDFCALVMFSLAGAILMTSFGNFVMLFLGVEILSIPLYILAGSNKKSLASNESSFKYFLMGAFASAFLLLGLTLVYGATGSFNIDVIGKNISMHKGELPTFFYAGVCLIVAGMSFKVSAVPFHFWAPDVYQGAPNQVTAFMSTVVKMAAFAGFYRLFHTCFSVIEGPWTHFIWIMAALSLLVGNITAIFQTSFKRLLAFSSVAHAGYLMLALLAPTKVAGGAIFIYTLAYGVASITAFTVLHQVFAQHNDDHLDRFNGLAKRNPFLAFALTVSMLSLAGIPPTGGFFAKYYLFTSALANGFTGLVIIAVIASLIGIYFYFKLIIASYLKGTNEGDQKIEISTQHTILLVISVVVTLLLGLFPSFFIGLFV